MCECVCGVSVCVCVCVCCCLVQHEPLEIFTETNEYADSLDQLTTAAYFAGYPIAVPYCRTSTLNCPFALHTSLAVRCDVTMIPADQIFTQNVTSSLFSVPVAVL